MVLKLLPLEPTSREKIQTRRNTLEAQIHALQSELAMVVIDCQHPAANKKYNGDGGSYYDPPSYWIELDCPDCGKRWTTPQ